MFRKKGAKRPYKCEDYSIKILNHIVTSPGAPARPTRPGRQRPDHEALCAQARHMVEVEGALASAAHRPFTTRLAPNRARVQLTSVHAMLRVTET